MIVVLHLGAHKTGTSLVQKYMRDRPKIMTRNRIAMLDRSTSNDLIGWGQEKILAEGLPELRRKIQRSALLLRTRYIVSHENALGRPFAAASGALYPNAGMRADKIADGLSDNRKVVVFYIRDQAAFLESYYLQTIHEGRHHLFDEWVKPKLVGSLSWRPLYDGLCNAFGKENVLIKDFGEQIRKGQISFLSDFFNSFMHANDEKFENFEYPARRNMSISDLGLELALKINPHLKSKSARKAARVFLQQNFSNADFPRPVLLSDKQKHAVQSEYAPENQEILRESELAFDAPHRSG